MAKRERIALARGRIASRMGLAEGVGDRASDGASEGSTVELRNVQWHTVILVGRRQSPACGLAA